MPQSVPTALKVSFSSMAHVSAVMLKIAKPAMPPASASIVLQASKPPTVHVLNVLSSSVKLAQNQVSVELANKTIN